MVLETEKFDRNLPTKSTTGNSDFKTSQSIGPIRRPLQSTGNQSPAADQLTQHSTSMSSTLETNAWGTKVNEFSLFNDYKLFDDTPSKNGNQLNSIIDNSLWSSSTFKRNQQPWNSVLLLNDAELSQSVFSPPSAKNEATSLTDADCNHIKSLWSNENK